jgi:UDP-glucose 4-epimerase
MYDIRPLILRPSNPYGPRQGHYIAQGVISTFLKQVRTNEPIIVYGDGNSTKDYIYIKDLIDQCYKLSFSKEVGTFNLGSGMGTSINEILNLINKITGRTNNIQYVEKKIYDVDHFILDISKINNVLGHQSILTLEAGISEVWNWVRANF